MRTTTCVAVLLLLTVAAAFAAEPVVVAQHPEAVEAAPPAAAQATAPMDMEQMAQQMGMGPEEAMRMKLLGQANMDPMMMLMLMGAMNGGGMDDDILGPLMFMKMPSGATAAPTQPVVLLRDDTLIIVDAGSVYKVGLATMTVMDTVTYRPQAAQPNLRSRRC